MPCLSIKDYIIEFDEEDRGLVESYTWRVRKRKTDVYVRTTYWCKQTKKYFTKYLHTFLMSPQNGQQVDHIDGNGLNNKRSNLRVCENWQNNCNKGLKKTNTSGYKGVWWCPKRHRFVTAIGCKGKKKTLGYYQDPKEAAKRYDVEALKLHGEYAKTNKQMGLL